MQRQLSKWPAGRWCVEWECFCACFCDLHNNLSAWAACDDQLAFWCEGNACGEAIVGPELRCISHECPDNDGVIAFDGNDMVVIWWERDIEDILVVAKQELFFSRAPSSQRPNVSSQVNVRRLDASLECETTERKWLWRSARRENCRGNEPCVRLSFHTSAVLSLDGGLWPTNVARRVMCVFSTCCLCFFLGKWPTVL